MNTIASQITNVLIVYSTVYSGADQRKHQSSGSLAFLRGIHRWPVNSPHKGPVTRKILPFDDVIMRLFFSSHILQDYLTKNGTVADPTRLIYNAWLFSWLYFPHRYFAFKHLPTSTDICIAPLNIFLFSWIFSKIQWERSQAGVVDHIKMSATAIGYRKVLQEVTKVSLASWLLLCKCE